VARRCRWAVFAVALIDNHVPIYRRTPEPNFSDLMRDLDGVVERPSGRSFNRGTGILIPELCRRSELEIDQLNVSD
jgi:hypothetical protein